MKPVEKPRIRYSSRNLFMGVPFGPAWICTDNCGVGVGGDPKSAYENWLSDRPKTHAEYWVRRLIVSILG